jgi:hypothetical protein
VVFADSWPALAGGDVILHGFHDGEDGCHPEPQEDQGRDELQDAVGDLVGQDVDVGSGKERYDVNDGVDRQDEGRDSAQREVVERESAGPMRERWGR